MMRFVLLVSVAPFALMSAPALSQATTTPERAKAVASDAPVETQSAVAQETAIQSARDRSPGTEATENLPTATEPATDDSVDPRDIVVTGYRASLGSAQAIKRNSDAILDAVVAQDIGKLPDNTAAESLARITGIQVVRNSD